MGERIGVVGLGRMGWALASRMAAKDQSVSGWTRSGVDADAAKASGFVPFSDLEELVAASDILVLSLFDDAAVREVLGQLSGFELTRKLVVETSTVSPKIVRSMEAQISARGGALIDAPLSGGPEMVLAGTIGIFVGGDTASVARFLPVSSILSDKVDHVGPLGAGAAAKIVNNMVLAGMWEALSEAVETGGRLGLPLETMLTFLEKSPAAAPAFKVRLPVIRGETDAVGFAVNGVVKDIGVMLSAATDAGLPVPAMHGISERFARVAQANLSERDLAVVVPFSFDSSLPQDE